jgi:hypothetical protein
VIGVGRPVSGSPPPPVFGKAMTSRIDSIRDHRRDPVDAEGDAAVRRRAEGERLEQEAELLGACSGVSPMTSKTRFCTSEEWMRIEPPPSSCR